MSSRSLQSLVPEFAEAAQESLRICADRGVEMLIFCTLRSMGEQARAYRRGRKLPIINAKIREFAADGFEMLAATLNDVGPQFGRRITYAGPGESWHNWGRAFDAAPLVSGKPAWNYEDNNELYRIYGEAVESCGLHWAGRWSRFAEFVHTQFDPAPNPLKFYLSQGLSPASIEARLRSFSGIS